MHKTEVEELQIKLKDISAKNTEILAAEASNIATIQSLEGELKEYKQKYEQTNAELEKVKGRAFISEHTIMNLSHIFLISPIAYAPSRRRQM